ncbi:hypothetical protein [Stagnihabitans tardus]|nr:hypothetical protein [Stagnihabitans tardus]
MALSPARAVAEASPSAERCAIFRQGPLQHDRLATYAGRPTNDARETRWLDLWYRPDYDFGGPSGGPDGLPNRSLLVDINLPDGQPLPKAYRNSANPMTKSFFTVLLSGGAGDRAIERIVYSVTSAPLAWEWPRPRTWVKTGETIGPYTRVEVEGAADWAKAERDVYVQTVGDEVISVMNCDKPGTELNPSCQVYEKAAQWEINILGFRRNQLDQLDRIRQLSQDFAACLTLPPG